MSQKGAGHQVSSVGQLGEPCRLWQPPGAGSVPRVKLFSPALFANPNRAGFSRRQLA